MKYLSIFIFLGVHGLMAQSLKTVVVKPETITDLAQTITTAPNNTKLLLKAGHYYLNRSCQISGKENLKIIGEGEARTIIHLPEGMYIGFEIGSDINGLEISRLSIVGEVKSQQFTRNTHAIGSVGGKSNQQNVVYRNLLIKNVAVGISIGSGIGEECTSNCRNFKVLNNRLEDIYGEEAGSGYGIHNECAVESFIAGNTIINATRHSIYQARGYKVSISNNILLNHGKPSAGLKSYYRSALVVARSSEIKAFRNTIENSYDVGLSVERDGPTKVEKVEVTNNVFIKKQTRRPDMWINIHPESVTLFRNNLTDTQAPALMEPTSGVVVWAW